LRPEGAKPKHSLSKSVVGLGLGDSGAPHFYCWDKSVFHSLQQVDEDVNGTTFTWAVTKIEGIGRVNFKTLLNGEVVDVSWDEVKYALEFQENITSTVAMTKKGITQVIVGNLCHFAYNGEVMCAQLEDSRWVMQIEPQLSRSRQLGKSY
jgi:hypothetical protein